MVVLGLPRQGSCRGQLPLAISATDAASHPALACSGSMIFSEDHQDDFFRSFGLSRPLHRRLVESEKPTGLRQCIETADGWQGVDENGTVLKVANQSETGCIARIPAENRIVKVLDGRAVGVILLERKRAKTKRPGDELREAKNLK
jgi:hypothetical protein